jgi:hypothetical protein
MSYDLKLVCVQDGETVDAAVQRLEDQNEESDPGPLDPVAEKNRLAVASVAAEVLPYLEPFEPDFTAVAQALGTTPEEAHREWRHVELNSTREQVPLQLTICDDHVSLTLAYWDTPEAESSIRDAVRVCGELCRRCGFVAYDPQLGREIDCEADIDAVRDGYFRVIRKLPQILADVRLSKATKPWWKFW